MKEKNGKQNYTGSLTANQKKKLWKALLLLAAVIIVFSCLSRTLFSGGETLSEYYEKNPQTLSEPSPEADASSDALSGNLAAQNDVPKQTASPHTEALPETSASGEEPINPDRVIYQTGFYYEPLSEDRKDFITGISYPAEGAPEISYEDLSYLHVLHYDFNGEVTEGELICNNAISQDLVEIFYELYIAEYQIEKITLIDSYDGDDTASMEDNNTSCFNYRTVDGTDRLSKHALGLAIDINPFYNPYVRYTKEGGQIVSPAGSKSYADRSLSFPYKIDTQDLCYRLFIEHGFIWGGNWNSSKDYQHFQKTPD